MSGAFPVELGKSLEYRLEPLSGTLSSVPDLGELVEVTRDLPFVPRAQDRFDVGKVFIERGAADPTILGNLRHGHRMKAVACHERRCGVKDRAMYLTAVRCNGFIPQSRHHRVYTLTVCKHCVLTVDIMSCKVVLLAFMLFIRRNRNGYRYD